MRYKLLIVAVLFSSSMGSVLRAEQSAARSDPLAENAALVYWQAFASIPELDEAQNKAFRRALESEEPIDADVTKTVSQAEESFHQLHRAAKCSRCVWGLDHERGIEMILPHLSQARELSSLACLRARLRFEEGKNSAAIDDIAATMVMARHVGENAIVISLLVDYAIEAQAIDVSAMYLLQLTPGELDHLATQIARLPTSRTIAEGWQMEKELLLGWFIRELVKPEGKQRVLEKFANREDPNVIALRELTQNELLDAATKLTGAYDKIIDAMSLTPDEVAQLVKELAASSEWQGNVRHLGALILPSAENLRRAEACQQTRLVLLQAAIAVARDGQDALQSDELRDPFGTGQLEYAQVESGFRLTSKLIGRDGKPVTLTVGRVVSE